MTVSTPLGKLGMTVSTPLGRLGMTVSTPLGKLGMAEAAKACAAPILFGAALLLANFCPFAYNKGE